MRVSLVACLFLLSPLATASPFFESVIDVMAIKKTESYTNNAWESADKIKGVTWDWPYYESGAHESSMVGKLKIGNDKNPNIGATAIEIKGARTFISHIDISIQNESAELSEFGEGQFKKIKTNCDEDSATYNVAFYQFNKPKYQPLFISQVGSWGASGSGTMDFRVDYSQDSLLNGYSYNCKVLP